MEINIHLHHGPLDVEIQADKEENYQQEVLDIIEFIEENSEEFNHLSPQQEDRHEEEYEQAPADSDIWEEGVNNEESSQERNTNGIFQSVSRATNVDESTLERIFDMPENEEQVPAIIIEEFEEGLDVLGSSRRERQARASLMLLYIWHEIRDVDEVLSSDLGDALNMSGIDPTDMYGMYDTLGGDADTYFNRTTGGNPTVKLSRRGKRIASNQIEEFTEHLG